MVLAQLRAENFRLFERLSLQLDRRLNLIIGANAAGKTSLLEAIYCLTRAKSFRSSSASEMAGKAARRWGLSGCFEGVGRPPHRISVLWDHHGIQINLDQDRATTILDLVRAFPAQVMEPGMHRLLQEGPGYRRSFLDWGVFHVEHRFLPCWRRFQRALKQRNHALRRGGSAKEVSVWNQELAEPAEQMHALREAHLQQIRAGLAGYIERMLGEREWELDLHPGWSKGQNYLETLERELERDRRQGMTVEGPHRAELRIKLQSHQVKNRISRGQQKLLICALILAQASLIRQHAGRAPILLVDDFTAELAADFQQALFDELADYPGQVFLTAFEKQGPLAQARDAAVFHVEHGRVRQC